MHTLVKHIQVIGGDYPKHSGAFTFTDVSYALVGPKEPPAFLFLIF